MTGQTLRQDIRTSLKLTASLTQSIKALQLSSQELELYIAKQLEDNPFLVKEEVACEGEDEKSQLFDKKISTRNIDSSTYDFIENIEAKKSLKEHLAAQIPYIIEEKKDLFIAGYITDLLDDNGYLQVPTKDIAGFLKIEENIVESLILKLQNLDPSGVYSRNLTECLKIQLEEIGVYNEKYQLILDNLELVAKAEFAKLARISKISVDELKSCINKIKKLEPKPGRNFSYDPVSVKIADVKISLSPQNELVISSNKEAMPILIVNKEYYNQIRAKLSSDEDKNYATEMLKNAHNLVRSVDMRSKTIVLVAEAIAAEQEEFFKRGILYLKPLTLAKIAQLTGYNESTISRATSNKYIETPYGVIEMKYFFSSGVKSKYSKEEVSSHKVKEIIRTLINEEDKTIPLSDDEIASSLRQFNVVAARRTVAKYREAINIPASSKRKRENIASLAKEEMVKELCY